MLTDIEISKIKKEYPSICYDCKYARKTWSNELRLSGNVGCCGRALEHRPFDHDVIVVGKQVAEGWVDLHSEIFDKGSGKVTNYQLITFMIKKCNMYSFNSNV